MCVCSEPPDTWRHWQGPKCRTNYFCLTNSRLRMAWWIAQPEPITNLLNPFYFSQRKETGTGCSKPTMTTENNVYISYIHKNVSNFKMLFLLWWKQLNFLFKTSKWFHSSLHLIFGQNKKLSSDCNTRTRDPVTLQLSSSVTTGNSILAPYLSSCYNLLFITYSM